MGNLIWKALAGLLALLAALGAFIFVSAGTFHYAQGWIYLIVFAVPVLLITLYLFQHDTELLERRITAGPAAEKEQSQKIIQSMAQLAFCSVYILAGLDHRFGWSHIPIWISLLAALLVVLGFWIVFLVFKENSYTSAVIEIDVNQTVVSTGPYKLVRHPMYTGAVLMMLFSPLALGSYWAELGVAFLVYSVILRLLDEERFLAENLAGYEDYCRKVRYHLMPFVW